VDLAADPRAALDAALQVEAIAHIAARRILRPRPAGRLPEKRRRRSGARDVGVDAGARNIHLVVGEKRSAVDGDVGLLLAAADDGFKVEIEPGTCGDFGLERLQRLAQPGAANAMEREIDRLEARLDRLALVRPVGEKNLAALDAQLAQVEGKLVVLPAERQARQYVEPGDFAALVADDLGARPVEMDGVKDDPALEQRQQRDADEHFRRGDDGHRAVGALEG
jgi:hypothetical protein